jgi:hypothetical protein
MPEFMKMTTRYESSKIVYERHLNDHPIKSHPLYKVWIERRTAKTAEWGAWLREQKRPAFDELYAKWKAKKL